MAPKKNKKNNNVDKYSARPNAWGFLQTVMLALVNKGQYPLVSILLVVTIILMRMPSEDISKIFYKLVDISQSWGVWSLVINLLLPILWFIQVKSARKEHYREIERISDEKGYWQEKYLGKELVDSSQKK